MMSKKKMMTGVLSAGLVVGLVLGSIPATAHAEVRWMESFDVSTVSKSSLKASWKKKKGVSVWKVYKATVNKEGEIGKYKKVATISGKKKSYTLKKLKKDKLYDIQIKGYKRSKGKLKLAYRADTYAYTGLRAPIWDEYASSDYEKSPSVIELNFGRDFGYKPTGYMIYRKAAGESKYKKIATVKAKKFRTYKDRKVKAGQEYRYKVKAYYKKSKKSKKIISKYSETLKLSATNRDGSYTLTSQTPVGQETDELVVKLQSKPYNGVLDLQKDSLQLTMTYDVDQEEYVDVANATITAYSADGNTWTSYQSPLKIKGNQTIWLEYKLDKKVTLAEDAVLYAFTGRYDGLCAEVSLGLFNGTGSAVLNMEGIH